MTQAFRLNLAPSHWTLTNDPDSQSQVAIALCFSHTYTHCQALQSVDGVSHLRRTVRRRVGVWSAERGGKKVMHSVLRHDGFLPRRLSVIHIHESC